MNKTEEELVQKHKKERKELQGQIQNLRKTIGKGDKKKKKEITEEISRLELNLKNQQDEDLLKLKLSQVNLTIDEPETEEIEESCLRITKAQKRRNKKAEAEKERDRQILEGEALNVFGKRNLEIQAINKILNGRGLMIFEIPSDGHCLYNAVAHQLGKSLGQDDLRKKTAQHLRENINDCLPFLTNPETDELLSSEQYEKYCNDVANTSAWGGAVELRVLARVLNCPIEVIHASGKPYIFGEEYDKGKTLIVTYHRHMYELGAHYNSVTEHVRNNKE